MEGDRTWVASIARARDSRDRVVVLAGFVLTVAMRLICGQRLR